MAEAERAATTWVVVVSLEHARRGVESGLLMANHGKKAPLAPMRAGDRILIYSPRTAHPDGEMLKAITIVGVVTGEAPEPSAVIPDGFCRAAELREIDPIPLDRVRDHLPMSKFRFGCFELPADDADAIVAMIEG